MQSLNLMQEDKRRPLKERYAIELQGNLFLIFLLCMNLHFSLYNLGMIKAHCEGLICEHFGFCFCEPIWKMIFI